MLHTTHTSHHTQAHTPHMLYTHPHTHLSEKVKVLVTQLCLTLYNLWTVVYQAPLSMEFSRQEYWSGLPSISPGESSWPRDRTWVCYTAGGFFTAWAIREDPHTSETHTQNHMLHTINTHTYTSYTCTALAAHTRHTPHVHALPADLPFILWEPPPLEASPVPPARGWIRRRSGGPLPDLSSLHCRCLSSSAEDGLLKARWVFSHVSTLFPHPCTSIALRTSANTSGTRICSSSGKSPVDQ